MGTKRVLGLILLAAGAACTSQDASEAELATRCIRASDDNRVKLSGSWMSSAEVEVDGDLVTIRTQVPIGISITGKLKFRRWQYRCRRNGDEMEFLGYETG